MHQFMPHSNKANASLNGEGWQLLSDELALIDKNSGLVHPVGRPISLKNKSIEIIKNKYKNLQPGSIVNTLTKGDVAHISLPNYCIDGMYTPLPASLIVFPQYNLETNFNYENLTKPATFLKTIENSFNYSQLGKEGFDVMGRLIDSITGYNIYYNNLDSAIKFIEKKMEH
jgi:HprK-related kinase A